MKIRTNIHDTTTLCRDIGHVFKTSGRVSRMSAFSLIEVLIVLAIIGILTAIAYPSYQNFVLRSHRATVQSEMQKIHTQQALYNVEHRQYASLSELGYIADSVGLDNDGNVVAAGAGRYDLSMTPDQPAGQFVIRASATAVQLADSNCLLLTMNANGDRTAEGCW
jgi:type IV pilus assembly protein PilE